MRLPGKVAVVTGASSGIGRALSIELARQGCRLLLTALEADDLAKLQHELESAGQPVAARPADLANPQSREALLDWVRQQAAPPDVLVNNAGAGGRFGSFAASDLADMQKVVELNIQGLLQLTHGLIPLLRARPEARIVNVSSGVARLPYPGLAVYGATKAFISSFSESLACELAGTRIRVLCFHPGFTASGFLQRSAMDMRKVPRFLVRSPEFVARRLVQALIADRAWCFSDALSGLSARFGALLPHGLRVRLFRDLFWKVPNDH